MTECNVDICGHGGGGLTYVLRRPHPSYRPQISPDPCVPIRARQPVRAGRRPAPQQRLVSDFRQTLDLQGRSRRTVLMCLAIRRELRYARVLRTEGRISRQDRFPKNRFSDRARGRPPALSRAWPAPACLPKRLACLWNCRRRCSSCERATYFVTKRRRPMVRHMLPEGLATPEYSSHSGYHTCQKSIDRCRASITFDAEPPKLKR